MTEPNPPEPKASAPKQEPAPAQPPERDLDQPLFRTLRRDHALRESAHDDQTCKD